MTTQAGLPENRSAILNPPTEGDLAIAHEVVMWIMNHETAKLTEISAVIAQALADSAAAERKKWQRGDLWKSYEKSVNWASKLITVVDATLPLIKPEGQSVDEFEETVARIRRALLAIEADQW